MDTERPSLRDFRWLRYGVRCLLASAAAAASLSCTTLASAQTITPVLLQLGAKQRIASVSVRNTSAKPVHYQSQLLAWQQLAGEDRFEESRDLLVVPPIARIEPGATQVFRLMLRQPPTEREKAYRLILEDVSALTQQEVPEMAVMLRVRHSLPVFVAGSEAPRPRVRVLPCVDAASPGCIRIENDGNRHVAVRSVSLRGADWQSDVPLGASRVLAGSWMQWSVPLPAGASRPFALSALTTEGPLTADSLARR